MTAPAKPFDVCVRRSSRRKTLSLIVEQGEVRVLAPSFVSRGDIDLFVQENTPWILQRVAHQQSQMQVYLQRNYISGETIPCLSHDLELVVERRAARKPILKNGRLYLSLPLRVTEDGRRDYLKEKLQQWYRSEALAWFSERVEHYQVLMNSQADSIRIKNYKAKWGSCSSGGELSFNWRLMLAPAEISDYVVVHEMCHLQEMNHSKVFWQLVAEYCPGYKQHCHWLKEHGGSLEL